jgi:hypothetical protein
VVETNPRFREAYCLRNQREERICGSNIEYPPYGGSVGEISGSHGAEYKDVYQFIPDYTAQHPRRVIILIAVIRLNITQTTVLYFNTPKARR